MTLPGPTLQRGFWLSVWQVETPKDEILYVGHTGHNSSPHATAPYSRMGQISVFVKTQNTLRKNLLRRGVAREASAVFRLTTSAS
jgi:hypothetical protein